MASKEKNKNPANNVPKYLINVISFVEREFPEMLGGKTYVLNVNIDPDIAKIVHISLPEFLGLIASFKGSWQSMGMAFNPGVGKGMEIAIQFTILEEYTKPFSDAIRNIISEKIAALEKAAEEALKDDEKSD